MASPTVPTIPTAPDWDPDLYGRFASARLRPAVELLARVPPIAPVTIVDLGCGAGGPTRLLLERWPQARVVGIDRSPQMLARAQHDLAAFAARLELVQAEIKAPLFPVDLLFSTAALHWLPDHPHLLRHLTGALAPGGVLAVQVPDNFHAPTHQVVRAIAQSGPWQHTLEPLLLPWPVLAPEDYAALLWRAGAVHVDCWSTTVVHTLHGDDPVFEWVSGTVLLPLAQALHGDERAAFLHACKKGLREAYPPLTRGGPTLLPFRRTFVVAQVKGGAAGPDVR